MLNLACLLFHLIHAARPTHKPSIAVAQVLEQPTALKVRIRVHDSVEIGGAPRAVVLDLFDLALVRPFEDAVARDVVALLGHVFLDRLQHVAVVHARALQYRCEVVGREGPVWTAVGLAGPWKWLRQELLTRVGCVASSAPVGVASNVAVRVPDVVFVFLLELVVCHELEGAPPEDNAFF